MRVGIIGSGACGLACATVLEKNNIDYLIFEQNKKPGSKILASGNGRCNIANKNIIKKNIFIDYNLLFDFLDKHDCPLYQDEEGRFYPLSNNSQTILDLFLDNINKDKLLLSNPVLNIIKKDDYYLVNNCKFNKLVLATGSIANINMDKANLVYDYLKGFNLKINKLKPSLVGFKVKENIKVLSGLRIKALVSLYNANKLIKEETGEIQFKDDGISGIVIMNMSYYYNQLDNIDNPYFVVRINPFFDYSQLKNYKYAIPNKLFEYFNKNNLDLTALVFHVKDLYDFKFAQVVSGGISLKEINSNFSLIKDQNIYVGGELLDLDYPCGGYNLGTAFNIGFMIGNNICNIK